MSTPFPLEQQAQVERPPTAWNPWQGPVRPSTWSMSINQNTDPIYMALEGLGEGAAKGEALLSGIWHTEYGLLAHVPGLRSIAGELERQTGAMQEDARERVKALTPDPTTTGAAAQTIHGLASGLYRVTVGSLAGGPAGGAALVGSTEAASRYQELAEQGVTPGAAAAAAGVSGLTSAAGALLPAGFGASLIGKVLTGGAGNVGFGLAARYADHKVLEAAGYPEMAAQQHVWDTTAVATDLLLGGGFGLLAHLHGAPPAATPEETRARIRELEARLGRNLPGAQDAALTVNLALRDRASAPGVPVDPAAAGAHQAALEKATEDLLQGKPVDVAGTGVENATFARRPPIERPAAQELLVNALKEGGVLDEERNLRELEEALGARLRGEKPAEPVQTPAPAAEGIAPKIGPISEVDIPRAAAGKLNDDERAIETRFAQALAGDYEGMKARYAALPDAQGGKVLNVDTARELSPDYLADRTRSAAVHEPASWFIKRLYAEKLAQTPGPGEGPTVLVMGGGTGAGKSTAIKNALGPVAEHAQIILDSNLNNFESARTKIDQALVAGKKVQIPYVFRGPIESLRHGALVRAMNQERDFGSGRTVPIESHIDTHVGSNEAIRQIAAHYAGDPRVEISVIDNSRGKAEVRVIPLAELPRLDYNFTREQALQTLHDELAAGRISAPVFRGFAGHEPGSQPAAGGLLESGPGRAAAAHGEPAALGPGARGQPEPQRAEQRPDQLAAGTESIATATGRKIEVRPKLVEAADILTSDREGYPQELQPRQRGDRVALAEQVRTIAQTLDPARLGSSAEADRGAPITGPDNVVESGNGRVMALRQVYADNPAKAAEYRDWLTSQGYDVSGMKEPVLVRERVTPLSAEERRAFTLEANQAATAALSPVERAQADARQLDAGVLSQLRGGELTTAQNAPFVRAFLGRLPMSERNALVNPDGTVSQEGVRRLQAAILAKAYGGTPESNAILGRMLESTDSDMRSSLGALLDAAPAFARLRQAIQEGKIGGEYDLARSLTQAVEATAQLREKGQALGEFLKQEDFLTQRSPAVEALMRALYDKKGERMAGRDAITQKLMNYADRALKQRLDQGMLFGDAPLAPEQLLAAPAEAAAGEGMRPVPDMFGLRTPQGKADAATEVARTALAQKPNLEIADENGEAVRGRSELISAEEAVQTTEERAPDALSIAANCSGQRAA